MFKTSFVSTCGNLIYHVGLIDYLQKYTFSKKVERYVKIKTTSAMPNEISSIDPDMYFHRFNKFMRKVVFDTN